ncbi:ABC transporter ATP-binding protein [Neptunomonas qingdaonensis]|uniref:Simple sugar transport system ATP-binding protein n=1 Tax=Neptunomonas qingdaonensis TaxID=1045558 RepID=A0A1I2LJ54_9GAMM|nr:ABC transporter ATP-binding protein [Neptunomonas qingdaonensis]SFF78490.1 simple sugar transport system ATP-binding protein [Neptunomonas qingdaonensis]
MNTPTVSSNPDRPKRLVMQGITKQYPGCLANDSVDLDIGVGEIHALLGENGAGKSTLMKIIYGVVKPDAGQLIWEGETIRIKDPAHARKLGIGMVFQHFSLFETLTVTENIALALGNEADDMKALAEKIRSVSARYGMALNPQRYVHSLSVGERQRVEIVRCLVQDIRLLILDEPTSVLTPQEVDTLFITLRRLAEEGCSILFISHKLNEVKALCHRATVLRAGRVSGACIPTEEDASSMARMMVGDETPISMDYDKVQGQAVFLQVRGLNQRSDDPFGVDLKNINLDVHAGEIVGIAGVAGNGQEELLAALSGEDIIKNHDAIHFPCGPVGHLCPEKRRRKGLAFVPEERLGRGAVPDMSLKDNALLTGFLTGLIKNGMIDHEGTESFAKKIIKQFKVKTPDSGTHAKSLSGGNLQKFIIGREIMQNPQLLVAAHPTWGVDIGAATAIHQALIDLRDQGAAILIVSEDIDELFLISDRLCAICDGALSPIKPTPQVTLEEVGRWMAGMFDELLPDEKTPEANIVSLQSTAAAVKTH